MEKNGKKENGKKEKGKKNVPFSQLGDLFPTNQGIEASSVTQGGLTISQDISKLPDSEVEVTIQKRMMIIRSIGAGYDDLDIIFEENYELLIKSLSNEEKNKLYSLKKLLNYEIHTDPRLVALHTINRKTGIPFELSVVAVELMHGCFEANGRNFKSQSNPLGFASYSSFEAGLFYLIKPRWYVDSEKVESKNTNSEDEGKEDFNTTILLRRLELTLIDNINEIIKPKEGLINSTE